MLFCYMDFMMLHLLLALTQRIAACYSGVHYRQIKSCGDLGDRVQSAQAVNRTAGDACILQRPSSHRIVWATVCACTCAQLRAFLL